MFSELDGVISDVAFEADLGVVGGAGGLRRGPRIAAGCHGCGR